MKRFNLEIFKNLVRAMLRRVTSVDAVRSSLRQLSRVGLLPEGIWRRLPVDCIFPVTIPDGLFFFYCSIPADTIGRALYWKGISLWEAETIPLFYQLAKNSRIVLDIGANTGFYSLLACAANPCAEVFSFEPSPKVFSCLVNNIAANNFQSRCHPIAAAVSNTIGQVNFCELDGDVPTASSLDVAGYRGNKGKVIKVNSITIDTFNLPAEQVDLVKIDVETFEDVVLEGMTALLRKHLPKMIIECNYDGPFQSVETTLRCNEYSIYHLTADGPRKVEHIVPDLKGKYLNFLCLPPQHFTEVLDNRKVDSECGLLNK